MNACSPALLYAVLFAFVWLRFNRTVRVVGKCKSHILHSEPLFILKYSCMSAILLVRVFELILLINSPLPIIILAFAFQNTHFLQSSKVTFDGALTHRQRLRHLFAGDCRRLFDKIEHFLLTLSEFRLRHVSVMVSDIRGVGRGQDDGLELGQSGFELGF